MKMAHGKSNQNSRSGKRGPMDLLWVLLFFPFKVRKRYLRYNAVLFESEHEAKHLQPIMESYRRNNTKLLNIFIHSPLALAVITALAITYWQLDGISRFTSKITDVPRINVTKMKATSSNIKHYFKEVSQAGRKIHFKYILYAIGSCYGLCFVGAMILSINDAWEEERLIKDALISNRYVDFNGDPWRTFWTPEAIIFHTYQCDSNTFVSNDKFWNTINFKPDIPVHFKSDANKIIIGRAYALPSIIDFSMNKSKF